MRVLRKGLPMLSLFRRHESCRGDARYLELSRRALSTRGGGGDLNSGVDLFGLNPGRHG